MNSTPATEFSNVEYDAATKNSNSRNPINITKCSPNPSTIKPISHENLNKSTQNDLISHMGRVGFEPTTPAMSRRYLNQARPPALVLQLLIFSLLFIYNCSLFSDEVDLEGLLWFLMDS